MGEHISLTVNGARRELDVEPRRLLVQAIREDLDLTGTHVGCDTSQCGACTVHRRRQGREVLHDARRPGRRRHGHDHRGHGRPATTLHPLQTAFWEKHGLQCGFCTPGMIMTAADLLARNSDPSDDEIRHAIEGNICRCTGYQNIVAAVRAAAAGHARRGRRPRQRVGRETNDDRRTRRPGDHPARQADQAHRGPALHHRRRPLPRRHQAASR